MFVVYHFSLSLSFFSPCTIYIRVLFFSCRFYVRFWFIVKKRKRKEKTRDYDRYFVKLWKCFLLTVLLILSRIVWRLSSQYLCEYVFNGFTFIVYIQAKIQVYFFILFFSVFLRRNFCTTCQCLYRVLLDVHSKNMTQTYGCILACFPYYNRPSISLEFCHFSLAMVMGNLVILLSRSGDWNYWS